MNYLPKPKTNLFSVETELLNFSIITFYVDPQKNQNHINPRFKVLTIKDSNGSEKALLSIVPFVDYKFHFKILPMFKFSFGQTNYRVYVKDTTTGEDVVWFLGTSLDFFGNYIPKKIWKLPWHRGSIKFDYKESILKSWNSGWWSKNEFEFEISDNKPSNISVFQSDEEAMFLLTHPLKGYYARRDQQLGSYSIGHSKLEVTSAKVIKAKFDLLERYQLWNGELSQIQSVLVTPKTDFTIYLPPRKVG